MNHTWNDEVEKLGGLMTDADLAMQLLVNVPAFYFGTSPSKFFDYISAGLPVLNNYPWWLSKMIGEHQLGFSVPPEDPEAFATKRSLSLRRMNTSGE